METVSVPLTQGKVAIIDAEDAERVLAHKWYAHESRGKFYAARQVRVATGKQRRVFLHHMLMPPSEGMEIDHANGDSLDDRKSNLRECKHEKNTKNAARRKDSTSGYKGVSLQVSTGRWKAYIASDGKNHSLGDYTTREEAARAYDSRAYELHGGFANLNFPDETPVPFVKPYLDANNTSGYVGVAWNKSGNKWVAYVRQDGKRVHLGSFTDPKHAAHVRDTYIKEFHLDLALNFPDEP